MPARGTPVCRFLRLYPEAPEPMPADPWADGMLPARACGQARQAAGLGWYLYPPRDFELQFSGTDLECRYPGDPDWHALRSDQLPGMVEHFAAAAPLPAEDLAPAFLAHAREPGMVNAWSGYLAKTQPGWSLLIKAPANVPRNQPYRHVEHLEGIVDTASWRGPLFCVIRLTRTNTPVEFTRAYPLMQVIPVPAAVAQAGFEVGEMGPADWREYTETMAPTLRRAHG